MPLRPTPLRPSPLPAQLINPPALCQHQLVLTQSNRYLKADPVVLRSCEITAVACFAISTSINQTVLSLSGISWCLQRYIRHCLLCHPAQSSIPPFPALPSSSSSISPFPLAASGCAYSAAPRHCMLRHQAQPSIRYLLPPCRRRCNITTIVCFRRYSLSKLFTIPFQLQPVSTTL